MALVIKFMIFMAGILALLSCGHAYSQRRHANMLGVSGLLLAVAIYCLGYSIEICSDSVEKIFDALRLQYVGISFIPMFVVMTGADLLNRSHMLTKGLMRAMMAFSVFVMLVVFTNDLHHLYYKKIYFVIEEGMAISSFDVGAMYYIFVGIMDAVMLGFCLMSAYMAIRSKDDTRKQYAVGFLASVLPVLAKVLYYAGKSPYGMDLSPAVLFVTAVLVMHAIKSNMMVGVVNSVRDVVFDNMSLLVIVLNKNNFIIDHNNQFMNLISAESEIIVGKHVDDVLENNEELLSFLSADSPLDDINSRMYAYDDDEDDQRFEIPMLGDKYDRIFESRDKVIDVNINGSRKYKASKCLIFGKNDDIIAKYAVLSDVSSESRMLEKLNYLANYDGLTKLMNRSAFYSASDRLLDELSPGSGVSVIMLDIDHFKRLNDSYGHMAGDEVLRRISESLASAMRHTDVVARFGGEEFVIFMSDIDKDTTVLLSERIRRKVESLDVEYDGNNIKTTISIGISNEKYVPGMSIDTLIERSDRALYHAKNSGRNRICAY